MGTHTGASDFFVVGGTMHPDSPSYVKRPTDDKLFDLTLAGEFCYVLTPRQMGKSSLMIRTARRLQSEGIRTAIIDLTAMGTGEMDTWYLDLLTELADALDLSVDAETWWKAHASLGQVRRFVNFLRDVVLTEIEDQVVIFIDEIDTTLNLDFSDDFFAAIRAMYNARAKDPRFNRLNFVLLGVATPSDLIEGQTRTPFNIGQAIDLQEFSWTSAQKLQSGWSGIDSTQRNNIMERIFHWTNGHPYLTQKLCAAVADRQDSHWTDERVDELVESLFLSEEVRKESNLKFVRARILTHSQSRQLLALYRKIRGGKRIDDDKRSALQNWLKLSGLIKAANGCLSVRNEIYRRAFDLAWVRENTPTNWAPIVAGIAIFVAFGFILYGILQNPNVCIPGKWCYPEGGALRDKSVFAIAGCGDDTLFAGTEDGIYHRAWGDDRWEQEVALDESITGLAVSSDCVNAYAAVLGGGVLRRTDGWWTPVAGPEMANTWAIVLLGDKILAGGDFGIRYLITNESARWHKLDVPFDGIVQHLAQEDGRLYAAVWGDGVWYADESPFDHWQPVGLTDEIKYAQRVNVSDNGIPRLVSTNEGLYWWDGTQWEKEPEPWSNARTFCFVDNRKMIFVGQENNGVLRSNDAGETWKPINFGWERPEKVRSLLVRTDDGGLQWLFAATTQGIWRYRLAGPRATPTLRPIAISTALPTLTVRPHTPTATSIATPTETPMATLRGTAMIAPPTPPTAIQPALLAPTLGGEYLSPVTLRWEGSLNPGQAYQVTIYHTESGHTLQSTLLTATSWSVDLPGNKIGEWRWQVSIVSNGSVLATSSEGMFWFNPYPGGGGDIGPTPAP
jgi:hypothetical protein